jgi:effector-binding domain-containing protein/glycine/D-amino acid oxidase-like deaminating enzyme
VSTATSAGGQLTTYFERPLQELVDTYGFDRAMAGRRAIDNAWDLLDLMVAESAATLRIERFVGHMGMFTLDHLRVHLTSSRLRTRAGLAAPRCVVADSAPFIDQIPNELAGLYRVVTMEEVRALLGTDDDRYCAVMSDRKGCANSALLVEQVLAYLQAAFADRFTFADHTGVERVILDSDVATVIASGHTLRADHVVMCTNGFIDHLIENRVGDDITASLHHRVTGDVGYMVGFVEDQVVEPTAFSYIRNEVISGPMPYVYVTSRPHETAERSGTLVCIGGPEQELDDTTVYEPSWEFPARVIEEVDSEILPIVHASRPSGLEYDYMWHGLMGYTESRVRLIGPEPKNPVLLYNLGCNGVGFLPSIYGGFRNARLLHGDDLEASIFDPPEATPPCLEGSESMPPQDIVIKQTEPIRIAEATGTAPGFGHENLGPLFARLLPQVLAHLASSGVKPGLAVAHYEEPGEDRTVVLHAGFVIDGEVPDTEVVRVVVLPQVEVVSTMHRGSMENVAATYEAMVRWIEDSGYRPAGPSRELYLEWHDGNESLNVTELQLPITR